MFTINYYFAFQFFSPYTKNYYFGSLFTNVFT